MPESKYDIKECSDFIINKIETEGLSLFKACEFEGMPSHSVFLTWCNNNEEIANKYARARECRADLLFEKMFEIANNEHQTEIINDGPNGVSITRMDHDKHRRLQIDTYKWALSKMQPKKYGDKVDITTDGQKIESPKTLTVSFNNENIDLTL